jgi:hypothetical protein
MKLTIQSTQTFVDEINDVVDITLGIRSHDTEVIITPHGNEVTGYYDPNEMEIHLALGICGSCSERIYKRESLSRIGVLFHEYRHHQQFMSHSHPDADVTDAVSEKQGFEALELEIDARAWCRGELKKFAKIYSGSFK